MRSLKTAFYVGLTAGVVSLNVLTYRVLQGQRYVAGQLAVITAQQALSYAEQALLRAQQFQQFIAHDEQGN